MSGDYDEWSNRVTPHFIYVVKQLRPLPILDQLKEKGTIDNGEYTRLRKIIDNKSEEDCNRELLTTVLNKQGPNSFKEFVKMLKDTNQQHIADRLTQFQGSSLEGNSQEDTTHSEDGRPPRLEAVGGKCAHVTRQHVDVVVRCCSGKWKALGRVLLDCDTTEVLNVVSGLPLTDTNAEKLRCIIEEWQRGKTEATVNQLVEACGHPGVDCSGIVIRELKKVDLL